MLHKIKDLVNKITDEGVKSEFTKEFENLTTEIDKIKNKSVTLDSIMDSGNSEFAELRKAIVSFKDAEIGKVRTKWESETKKPPSKENDSLEQFQKLLDEKLSPLFEQVTNLTGQKKKESNISLAMKKLTEKQIKSPDKLIKLMNITAESTETDINSQIENAVNIFKELNANIVTEPETGGNGGGDKNKASKEVTDFVAAKIKESTDKK